MGPLELMYSWQALLVAIFASGLTQFVKTAIDVSWGKVSPIPTPGVRDMARVGKAARERSAVIDRLLVPALAPVFGFVIAALIPVYPDALHTYVTDALEKGLVTESWTWSIYGLWGMGCGQFADYAISKVKRAITGAPTQAAPTPAAPAAASDGNEG